MEHTKCLIIGSGPAGYTAALYAGRANLEPVLYCGLQMGGQLTTTTVIENFPGYPEGVDANQMMMEFRQQAERFGADIRDGIVTDVNIDQKPYVVTNDRGDQISADTIIVATGASAKYLGLPDEKKYAGQGIYLAGLASKVYLIVRKPFMRASEIMQRRVEENPQIEILYETNTEGLYGERGVEGAHLVYRRGEADERKYDLPIDGFFLAIGHTPNTGIFRGKLDLDEVGYIMTQPGTAKTNVPGIFAAGDCADSVYRQAVVAAGSGCMAALEADRFLSC